MSITIWWCRYICMAGPRQRIRRPRHLQNKPNSIDSHHWCCCSAGFGRYWYCCCPYFVQMNYLRLLHWRAGHWCRCLQTTVTPPTSQQMHSNRVTFRSQSMLLSLSSSMPQMLSSAKRLHSLKSIVLIATSQNHPLNVSKRIKNRS